MSTIEYEKTICIVNQDAEENVDDLAFAKHVKKGKYSNGYI